MVAPLTYDPNLAAGPMLDVVAQISAVALDIQSVRHSRGLRPLVCPPGYQTAPILMGQEWLRREHAPPRIVLVPTHLRNSGGSALGIQPMAGLISERPLKVFWRAIIGFDAHLWGDSDVTAINSLVDFNTTIELYRELLGAMVRVQGGIPNVSIGEARWDQPTDDRRAGRLLVVPIGFYADITDEPYVVVPWATQSTSGLQASITVTETVPDGSSSTSSGFIIAPP
jgi:hypothetical protein